MINKLMVCSWEGCEDEFDRLNKRHKLEDFADRENRESSGHTSVYFRYGICIRPVEASAMISDLYRKIFETDMLILVDFDPNDIVCATARLWMEHRIDTEHRGFIVYEEGKKYGWDKH